MWPQLIYAFVMMVISFALQMIMTPKRNSNNNVTEGTLNVPTATEGKTIPVVFGTVLIKDANVVDYFDITNTPIKNEGRGK